jgi:hypothetical protein
MTRGRVGSIGAGLTGHKARARGGQKVEDRE